MEGASAVQEGTRHSTKVLYGIRYSTRAQLGLDDYCYIMFRKMEQNHYSKQASFNQFISSIPRVSETMR